MTSQEINIAIAEHIGWTGPYQKCFVVSDNGTFPVFCGTNPEGEIQRFPNFWGSLNAMHEAECFLEDEEWSMYDRYLVEGQTKYTWHATSEHRAEAFLRTVGKWIE